MKKSLPILILSVFSLLFACCSSDDGQSETATFAVPIVKSLAKIRSEVGVKAARQTNSDGKIYVTTGYLFYIAQESGVHIFNNQNPSAPVNVAFIELAGVHDIAVKGNRLYADNYIDLVVFDISNMQNITLIQTLENAISFYPAYPEDTEFYTYQDGATNANEIVTGYKKEIRQRPKGGLLLAYDDATAEAGGGSGAPNWNGGTGTGGSYARFQINNNALYTVDSYQLNVFNIANNDAAFYDKAVYMNDWFFGGQLETLFKQDHYLFVGATNGMQIVDATDEFNPVFVSGFSHATACDPVVVEGNTAYITVRGGTTCGAIEDQVNVIDVADISNPTLLSTTLLTQPRGLGIRNHELYVCCSDGLKIFDATDNANLIEVGNLSGNFTDVIPMSDRMIAVAPNKIIQYRYGENFTLEELSVLNF